MSSSVIPEYARVYIRSRTALAQCKYHASERTVLDCYRCSRRFLQEVLYLMH